MRVHRPVLPAVLVVIAIALVAWTTDTRGDALDSTRSRAVASSSSSSTSSTTSSPTSTTASPAASPTPPTDRRVAARGSIYWLGDSITSGFSFYGDLAGKLRAAGYGPVTIDHNPGRSITGEGFWHQSGLQAVENDADAIRAAQTIVVELGVNPETTLDFASAQSRLLRRLHELNPRARVVWIDIAGSVNVDYAKSLPDYVFVDHRVENEYKQNLLYANAKGMYPYEVVSQFQLVWGADVSPSQLLTRTYPDPHHLLQIDGVHYTVAACDPVAQQLIDALTPRR
jgi:hypothetical protein